MRPWAQALADAGLSVSLPRLPGHGTRWQDLSDTRWPDWYGELERSFDALREHCRLVFVAGLSMGGTLSLRLAQQRGADVAGLLLVNPSLLSENRLVPLLPVLSRVVRSYKSIGGDIKMPTTHEASYDRTPLRALDSLRQLWALTRADLQRITQPLVLFHSRVDHVVEPLNSRILLDQIKSKDVTEHILEDSYHVATLDYDAPKIFAESVTWVAAHADVPAGRS